MKKTSLLAISGDWTTAPEYAQGRSRKGSSPCDTCPRLVPNRCKRRIASAQDRKKVA